MSQVLKARATWLPIPLHSYHGPRGGRDQAQHRGSRWVSRWVGRGRGPDRLSLRGSPLLSLHGLLVGERLCSVLCLQQIWGKTHQLRGSCCSGETGRAEGELAGSRTRSEWHRRSLLSSRCGQGPHLSWAWHQVGKASREAGRDAARRGRPHGSPGGSRLQPPAPPPTAGLILGAQEPMAEPSRR